MTLHQNQLQEDFLSDFSDVRRKANEIRNKTPTRLIDTPDYTKDVKTSTETSKGLHMLSLNEDEVDRPELEHDRDLISLFYEKINALREKTRTLFIGKEGELLEFTMIVERIVKKGEKIICNIPNYEKDLTVLSSVFLFFDGGSWAGLASIIAAVQLFDTKAVLEEAYEVGSKFMFVEILHDKNIKCSRFKKTFEKIGMQIALMLAVLNCDCWGEICISLAFGCKLAAVLRFEEFFVDGNSLSDDDSNAGDIEWFKFLSSVWGALISSTIFAVWPGLITAMYMACIGIQSFTKGQCTIFLPATSEPYELVTWTDLSKPSNQFNVWILIVISALWQAYYSFTGLGVYFTVVMILLLVVKLVKLLRSSVNEDKLATSNKLA